MVENIALFDMDGTLCEYNEILNDELRTLCAPKERFIAYKPDGNPEYIEKRAALIRASEDWWEGLPKFQLGWEILQMTQKLEFRTMILTQGPKRNAAAWAGKKRWIDNNLGRETDITITRDKGLVYGKVLVDDYPKYIERWLKWRKRGLVIMPSQSYNKGFKHPQVIRYDGTDKMTVWNALKRIKDRKE